MFVAAGIGGKFGSDRICVALVVSINLKAAVSLLKKRPSHHKSRN